MFTNVYQSLKQGYQQSWLKFLFRNASLARLIAKEQEPSAFEFFHTYLSSWWWNRWWFKACIKSSEAKHQFDYILKSLQYLTDNGFFTKDNCLAVVNHANLDGLARALSDLQRAGILSETIFSLIANHANLNDLKSALSVLRDARILTEAIFRLVANHTDLNNLEIASSVLQGARILTEANFSLVANQSNTRDWAYGLSSLQEAGILTETNFSLIANHADPIQLGCALFVLRHAGILTEDNRTLVANHANTEDLALVLSRLWEAQILTETNFSLVANHANPRGLAIALLYFKQAGIFTQLNFDALVASNHIALVSQEAVQLIWYRIPDHLLTQAYFNRLIMASEQANPITALQGALNQILGVEAGHAAAFNPGQSTHTASVHRSVSASALRLMASYRESINLEAKIKEIKAYVMGLDDSPKHGAAKRCIVRMTSADDVFTDSSGVSTLQLLALAWVAIHDETKCKGALEDAKALFVEGLYEIQRGYNLNAQGIDNQSPEDSPICSAGTFNKLMEKLNGIHLDVEVYFITHEGLCIKFPKVVAKLSLDYLNHPPHPVTVTGYLSMKALLDSIKENGLGPIWDKIKSAVKEILWDEFKEMKWTRPIYQTASIFCAIIKCT